MKERIDFRLVGALLRRHWQEKTNAAKRGKDRDVAGFALRFVLIAAFIAIFVLFFNRFIESFVAIRDNGLSNPALRTYQLTTIAYTAVLFFLVIGGITAINREMFTADDMKLFAAMPVGASSLFVAKLIIVYLGQFFAAVVTLLPVNITIGLATGQGAWFYGMTALTCFVFPLVSIAIASFFALPFYLLKQFLNARFILYFVVIVALTAVGFAVYALLLNGVKELLLGGDLRYFFDDNVMNGVAKAVACFYPARWFADWLLQADLLQGGLCIAAVLVVFLSASLVLIRFVLQRMLQQRIAGSVHFKQKPKEIAPRINSFFALVKKEFLQIFRTPSYTFSYFSVAVVMPLMVYFCMSISSSLVEKLIGLDCRLELAIFLTLLFGALTNTFCATNISRDGAMFYSIKAMPVSWQKVFFSKVFLCMVVTFASQLVSAILLAATGYIGAGQFFFLLAIGLLSGFAEIAIATRFDFNHARFYTEEDGEAKESGNTVSLMIVLSLVFSFLVGGVVLYVRMVSELGGKNLSYVTYLVAGVVSMAVAALAYYYLIRKLNRKYYQFSGGGGV